MAKVYICDKHGKPQESFCPDCMEAFENRRDASTMTPEERASEFEWWGSMLTIPFSDLHKRIEELAGRSVWTHELANPEQIIAAIRSGQQAKMARLAEVDWWTDERDLSQQMQRRREAIRRAGAVNADLTTMEVYRCAFIRWQLGGGCLWSRHAGLAGAPSGHAVAPSSGVAGLGSRAY